MKEYHKYFSKSLGREMEFNRYGRSGTALLAFASEKGRFFDYEDQGMIGELWPWIESGTLQVFTADSVDGESWSAHHKHPHDRAVVQQQYDGYVAFELLPRINELSGPTPRKPITFGCSMGGYHALNTYLRHPELFSGCISLSGVGDMQDFIGDYSDDLVHQHVPVHYLGLEHDEARLNAMRQGDIVVCVGQGAYEDTMRRDTDVLEWLFNAKQIPAWVDRWGQDVNHDWPWWKKQLPHFLSNIKLG